MKAVIYNTIAITSCVITVAYLASCLSGFINPALFWPLTFLALGFPILAMLMLVMGIGWLFLNKRVSLLLLILFAAGFKNLSNVLAFNTGNYNVEKNKQSLRIMSWNVRSFDNNSRHAEHPDSIRRRMINFLKQQDADVLLLQEFAEYHHETIYSNTQMLRDSLGYRYYYTSRDVILYMSYGPVEYGSAIFSKYPLTDTVKLNYQGLALPESAISGSINFQNKKLRLVTTHLVSMNLNKGILVRTDEAYKKYDSAFIYGTSKFTKLKVYDQLHARQAVALKKFAAQFKEPLLISGDFNSVPSSYTYNVMKEDLNDAFLSNGFGLGRTYASLSPTLRIDYILTDKTLKVAQFYCPQIKLSDHFPVIADIKW
ncbi:MAG: endonuclease/exonuclease/phosphatase family protein [Chitinophagaceae bacterium]|nr:endonuclease/exonuclease/phosphatase family protein [Chitinophagaceae bacterium]